jgi:hypothetical protein
MIVTASGWRDGVVRSGQLQEHRFCTTEAGCMRVSILDDYFDTLRALDCFVKLDGP